MDYGNILAGQIYLASNIFESSKNDGRSNIFELSKNIGRSRRRGGESETDESSLPQIPLFRISQPLNLLHLDICSFPDIPASSRYFPDIFARTCNTLIIRTWKILLFPNDKISRKLLQESWLLFVFVLNLVSWSLNLN